MYDFVFPGQLQKTQMKKTALQCFGISDSFIHLEASRKPALNYEKNPRKSSCIFILELGNLKRVLAKVKVQPRRSLKAI